MAKEPVAIELVIIEPVPIELMAIESVAIAHGDRNRDKERAMIKQNQNYIR
jgi:hypothetical protein